MARNSDRQGGADSWKYGVLKRPLPPITLIQFGNFTFDEPQLLGSEAVLTVRLHGVNANLALSIAAAIVLEGSNQKPDYIPLPGTLSVIPWTHTANGDYLYMDPLTISPKPLPAWFAMGVGTSVGGTAGNPDFGSPLADGCDINLTIDGAEYDGTEIQGQVMLQVTATYNGNWWDIDTIMKLFGDLRMDQPTKYRIRTSGEGG